MPQDFFGFLMNMSIPQLLKDCTFNAIKNVNKTTGKRYSDDIKKLMTYIYIRGGLYLFEFFTKNMMFATAKTIRTFMNSYNSKLIEGRIYASELKNFLVNHNLPLEVIIAEDGTKISEFVEYDLNNNILIGLVSPLEESTGLPKELQFKAFTAQDIYSAIAGANKSSYVQVIIAKCSSKGKISKL